MKLALDTSAYRALDDGNEVLAQLVGRAPQLALPITAKLFGEIAVQLRRAGRPIQQDGMWIAALCKQYDYILATADRDFAAVTGLEPLSF